MLQVLIDAIKSRQVISFTYSGFARVAQPATVGLSRTGKESLRCYQTQGGHVTQGHEWDFCDVSKMSNLKTTGATFANDPPGYKRGDAHMMRIFAEL